LLLQILSYIQLRNFPEFLERWYSTSPYPIISRAMQIAQGWILFSFGGLLYVVILIVAMRFLIVGFRKLFTLSRKRTYPDLCRSKHHLAFFHISWSFNY
jgi:hypothetical protein